MYIRSYSINYSTTLIIIIIIIIIHTIQYIYYNYTHSKYDVCLHYIVSCEEAMLYTNSCIYYTMPYYMYIYMPYPLWYMTMDYNLIHYINILYYYYYNNYNSYLFFIFIIVLLYVYACMRVLCCVVSLVCMCALLCVLAHAHTCVSVCVYPASPSWTVLWWRG